MNKRRKMADETTPYIDDSGHATTADDPQRALWYGACGYWTDNWPKLTKVGPGIPACPECKGVGFVTNAKQWFEGLERYEANEPGHKAKVEARREKCPRAATMHVPLDDNEIHVLLTATGPRLPFEVSRLVATVKEVPWLRAGHDTSDDLRSIAPIYVLMSPGYGSRDGDEADTWTRSKDEALKWLAHAFAEGHSVTVLEADGKCRHTRYREGL